MISRLSIAALTLGALVSITKAEAATYTYVGSWELGQGAHWTTNPPVYSGQEAAAFLFGGTASQYVISTVSSNVSDINFSTWLDGWADDYTYARSGNPASDTYSLDTGGSGYNSNPGYQSAYSALVQDHFAGTDPTFTNYAFLVSSVPLPASAPMFGVALLTLGVAGYGLKRKGKITA